MLCVYIFSLTVFLHKFLIFLFYFVLSCDFDYLFFITWCIILHTVKARLKLNKLGKVQYSLYIGVKNQLFRRWTIKRTENSIIALHSFHKFLESWVLTDFSVFLFYNAFSWHEHLYIIWGSMYDCPKILIEIKMNNRHIYSNGLKNQGLSVEVIIQ